MKKFNRIIILMFILYFGVVSMLYCVYKNEDKSNEYKVEINRIYLGLVEGDSFAKPNLSGYKNIKEVSFISKDYEREEGERFFKDDNTLDCTIKPWYKGEELFGYLRFDYETKGNEGSLFSYSVLGVSILFIGIIIFFIYIKACIINPFNRLSNVAVQLSKGDFSQEMKESKSRYFGRFIWGINLLRESLDHYKRKELKLEREKKMLLLSISHDIKTPLNSIKLYAKGIEKGVYEGKDGETFVSKRIEEKTVEIDNFIKEIVKTSSEDILEIQVFNSEFYLEELVSKVSNGFKDKCSLNLINFRVMDFENKLLKGDLDRAYEGVGNIIENAIKYGDGGEIEISFYEEEYCQLIRIYNSGEVLGGNEMIHLFDSFYRGTNAQNKDGNGLGLYICKYIMEKMEGDVFVQCEDGGMSFILVFGMI